MKQSTGRRWILRDKICHNNIRKNKFTVQSFKLMHCLSLLSGLFSSTMQLAKTEGKRWYCPNDSIFRRGSKVTRPEKTCNRDPWSGKNPHKASYELLLKLNWQNGVKYYPKIKIIYSTAPQRTMRNQHPQWPTLPNGPYGAHHSTGEDANYSKGVMCLKQLVCQNASDSRPLSA